MTHQTTDTQAWPWECVGVNQGPAYLGPWQARAFVAERPKGWYVSAEGQKNGPEYTYRLPGRNWPTGPYPRDQAEGIARQMIGLAPDASVWPADRLVLYRPPVPPARGSREAKDVTGRMWTPFTGAIPKTCGICGVEITGGWAQGSWRDAYHHVCDDHVELREEIRPADC